MLGGILCTIPSVPSERAGRVGILRLRGTLRKADRAASLRMAELKDPTNSLDVSLRADNGPNKFFPDSYRQY
jgi:hypothetical protein